jgi:hypothetical protein
VELASAEYLLKKPQACNGGTIVLMRATHSTIVIVVLYVLYLLLLNAVDPNRTSHFSMSEVLVQTSGLPKAFGTVFAATYAALYTRFASQWTYLAGLYNQIKAVECKAGAEENALAQWKAGFIEDASDLHLLSKKMFASVVKAWGANPDVRNAFATYSCGGGPRFDELMAQADDAWNRMQGSSPGRLLQSAAAAPVV